jgi:[ribosomal protein S5]-alanine N-acetyltransferase
VRTPAREFQNKIILRPLTPNDITDDYVRWWRNKKFTKYIETKTLTKQQAIDHIRYCNTNGCFLCAIIVDGEHVGNVKLNAERDLSIIIFPPYWGKGYATEAISKMVAYAGGRITAGVRCENIGSLRAFEKAGFTKVGSSQEVIYLANNPELIGA